MQQILREEMKKSVQDLKLPRYNEIPDVGLYLEQTAKYISNIAGVGDFTITGSMISNYVKKGLISSPVKKQYSRDQIAYLIFISMTKSVLSMEDIKLLIEIQQNTYEPEVAYTYLVEEFENVLGYVFGLKEEMETIGRNNHEAKIILRNLIITIAHKAYLDKSLSYYRAK